MKGPTPGFSLRAATAASLQAGGTVSPGWGGSRGPSRVLGRVQRPKEEGSRRGCRSKTNLLGYLDNGPFPTWALGVPLLQNGGFPAKSSRRKGREGLASPEGKS